jgi:3-dehydroquinate dehydratase-2
VKIVVANGPNLNLLGSREPEIYGSQTLADLEAQARDLASKRGCDVAFFQTNSEGELLDFLQREAPGSVGVVLNPGAFSHYSYALYDCLRALPVPVVEVHISNVHARREEFRHESVTAAAAAGVIAGLGARGYLLAMEWLLDRDK